MAQAQSIYLEKYLCDHHKEVAPKGRLGKCKDCRKKLVAEIARQRNFDRQSERAQYDMDRAAMVHALYQESITYDELIHSVATLLVQRKSNAEIRRLNNVTIERLRADLAAAAAEESKTRNTILELVGGRGSLSSRIQRIKKGEHIEQFMESEDKWRRYARPARGFGVSDLLMDRLYCLIDAAHAQEQSKANKKKANARWESSQSNVEKPMIMERWRQYQTCTLPKGISYKSKAHFSRELAQEFKGIVVPETILSWIKQEMKSA